MPLKIRLTYVTVMPTQMTSHDQKSNVAPHFNCLGLWKAMVSLTSLLASCDVPKKNYAAPHFNHHLSKECSDAIEDDSDTCDIDTNTNNAT